MYSIMPIRGTRFLKSFQKLAPDIWIKYLGCITNIPEVTMDFEHVLTQLFSLKVSILGHFWPFWAKLSFSEIYEMYQIFEIYIKLNTILLFWIILYHLGFYSYLKAKNEEMAILLHVFSFLMSLSLWRNCYQLIF